MLRKSEEKYINTLLKYMNPKNNNLKNSKSNNYNKNFILNSSFSDSIKENDICEDSHIINDDENLNKNIRSKSL